MTWRAHFADILQASDPRPVELLSGLCSLVWGLWLLAWPGAIVGVNAFRYLAWLPGWAWGLAFLSVGLWRFVALGTNRRRLRQYACAAAFVAWLFVGLLAVQGNPLSPNGTLYVVLGLANGWVWWRLLGVLHG